jgi:hypothetical protein
MKKTITILSYIIFLFPIWLLVYLNIKLYSAPDLENREETKQEVISQLNFLNDELKNNNLGNEMQSVYPEGYVFINALYGLTWAEIAGSENHKSELYLQALSEARYAYKQLNSVVATDNFEKELVPKYGIFYSGWKNYLLAKILAAQEKNDTAEVADFTTNCNAIANAISTNKSPYPESYTSSCWPADAFVAVASLKLHDEIFDVKYDTTIKKWLSKVKSNLDEETKLIPHSVDADSGKTKIGTRGSSICLLLIFMADIDPDFAQEQFKIFLDQFPVTRFGLPAIREYPKGKDGKGDIDSGPVLLDIGFAGTIVAIGTLKKFGEYNAADKISGCIESFGFPISTGNKKKYLFGKFPIADAFIAWSRMQEPNIKLIKIKGKIIYDFGSNFMFHLLSSLIIITVFLIILRKKIRRFIMAKKQEG